MSYEDIQKTSGWIFVIDTDTYGGNFERELTAYITGQVGECEVGNEMAELYKKEVGKRGLNMFEDLLEHRADEDGCHRPCTIYPTSGWFNHGMGGNFKEGEEVKALKHYIKECERAYGKEEMAHVLQAKKALEKGEKYSNWTMAAVEREIKRLNKLVENSRKTKKVNKYHAYMSVAIFFFEKPSPALVAIMKGRAFKFVKAKRKLAKERNHFWDINFKLNIEKFRLIKESLSVTEEVA
jgi:hypothetical protein